jgi:PAS domain S-box-containing protein
MTDPFVERSFSYMVEKVSDYAIFLLEVDGTIQTWNPAAAVMKGYTETEAIGCNFSRKRGGNERTARYSGRWSKSLRSVTRAGR